MDGFFNTTNESGQHLKEYRSQAKEQDERVLQIFRGSGKAAILPPSFVSSLYDRLYQQTPITSIRRSITNLTKAGKLEKTNQKRIGPYARPEYCWQIARGGSYLTTGAKTEPGTGEGPSEIKTTPQEATQRLKPEQGKLF